MSIAVVYTFPKASIAIYDRHLELRSEQLRNQPARRSHVCFETDGGYTVIDVWDSLEAFERFGELMAEIAAETLPDDGDNLPGSIRIAIHRVHNVIP